MTLDYTSLITMLASNTFGSLYTSAGGKKNLRNDDIGICGLENGCFEIIVWADHDRDAASISYRRQLEKMLTDNTVGNVKVSLCDRPQPLGAVG